MSFLGSSSTIKEGFFVKLSFMATETGMCFAVISSSISLFFVYFLTNRFEIIDYEVRVRPEFFTKTFLFQLRFFTFPDGNNFKTLFFHLFSSSIVLAYLCSALRASSSEFLSFLF